MPVSRQRTPRTEAMAGQPQVGLFVLSLSVSQYVSNYRDIAAKSHHAGFNILTWECKNIQKCMYNDVCIGANALKHLGMLILFCLYMYRSFAVCIAIYYAADLFIYFTFFLYLHMTGLFVFHRKGKGFIQVWNNMRVSKWWQNVSYDTVFLSRL